MYREVIPQWPLSFSGGTEWKPQACCSILNLPCSNFIANVSRLGMPLSVPDQQSQALTMGVGGRERAKGRSSPVRRRL